LEKNFTLLWKSKIFMITILLGPLVLALLLGMAFNNADPYSLTIGIYNENTNEVKEQILGKLLEHFTVLKFHNKDSCIDSIKIYATHICIILPETLSLDDNQINEILFYVDHSRTNLVWMVLDTLSDLFSYSSSEISTDLTAELLYKLDLAKNISISLKEISTMLKNTNEAHNEMIAEIEADINELNILQTQTHAEDSLAKNTQLKKEADALIKSLAKKIADTKDAIAEINVGNNTQLQSELDSVDKELSGMRNLLSQSPTQQDTEELNSLLTTLDADIFTIQQVFASNEQKRKEIRLSLNDDAKNLQEVQSLTDDINTTVANLRITNPAKIATPLITEIRPITTENTHFSFIFPTLIMLIIVFTSIILSSSIILMEEKSKASFRNYISSTSHRFFLLTYLVTDFIIIAADLSIFLLVSQLLFDIAIPLSFFPVLFLIIFLFILLGSVIGYFTRSEQSNLLLGITVSSTLVFFSNTIIPIESVPSTLREIIKYNPFIVGETVLRKLLVYKSSLSYLTNDILIMFIYILLFVAILLFIPKRKPLF